MPPKLPGSRKAAVRSLIARLSSQAHQSTTNFAGETELGFVHSCP